MNRIKLLLPLIFLLIINSLKVYACGSPSIANFTIDNQSICKSDTITFTSTSTNTGSWLWVFKGGTPDSAFTEGPHKVVYNDTSPSTLEVRLYTKGLFGNDMKQDFIEIIAKRVVADFTFNSDSIQKFNFTNTSTGDIASIRWEFGDGTTSNSMNPTHVYPDTSQYTACLILENGCSKDSICQTVYNSCNLFIPKANYNYDIILGSALNFRDSSSFATNWSWDFGDGMTTNGKNPMHSYKQMGVYNSCLTVDNVCGVSQYCKNINISFTSINNTSFSSMIKIYPNPVGNILYIDNDNLLVNTLDIEIEFYNNLGKLIYKTNLDKSYNNNQIDVSRFSEGIYYIKMFIGEELLSEKITIVH